MKEFCTQQSLSEVQYLLYETGEEISEKIEQGKVDENDCIDESKLYSEERQCHEEKMTGGA